MCKQQQAFLATIRTSTEEKFELIVAATEHAAQTDAEASHGADDNSVLISVERVDVDTVVICGASSDDPVEYATSTVRASVRQTETGQVMRARFASLGSAEPIYRDVVVLRMYSDGRARVRLLGIGCENRTATVHVNSLHEMTPDRLAA